MRSERKHMNTKIILQKFKRKKNNSLNQNRKLQFYRDFQSNPAIKSKVKEYLSNCHILALLRCLLESLNQRHSFNIVTRLYSIL